MSPLLALYSGYNYYVRSAAGLPGRAPRNFIVR